MAAGRVGLSIDEYRRLLTEGLKHCWRCKVWRIRSQFGVDRSRSDKLMAICNGCRHVPPKQFLLFQETQAEYERRRYANDATYRASRRQRSAHYKRNVEPVPLEGREVLLEDFSGRCAYCQKPATTWDHLLPVSSGGRTIPGNIVPACVSCNSKKGNRDLNDFIEKYDIEISTELESVIALGHEWGQL